MNSYFTVPTKYLLVENYRRVPNKTHSMVYFGSSRLK